MTRPPLLAVLALALLPGCETGIGEDWRAVQPRVPAPDFTLASVTGEPVNLAALRGRIVVADFWATWCTPCRFSLPSLELVAKRYADRGVAVLLIDEQEKAETVRAWLEGRFTAATVLLDQDGRVSAGYHVGSIPRLFVVDAQGNVAYTHTGYGGGLERSLGLILDGLLGEGPAPAPAAP